MAPQDQRRPAPQLSDHAFTAPRTHLSLRDIIDAAIAAKPNWKPSTKEKHEICGNHLTQYLGDDRDIRTINRGDCERWREAMLQKLARSTVSKMVKQARSFFKRAVSDNLIEENPFDGIKAGSEVNSERLHFVSQAITQRVIDAAPDVRWRTIIALARYGGCRTPSETLRLRWSDINWERGRVLVRSVKTEHHEGKATRFTPLFPELRTILEEAFELAPEGEDRIVYRYAETDRNLRTEMGRIFDRAGEDRRPRIFQNLRASRETELCRKFPLHVVAAWLGNTPKVAEKHYLDVTEEDFQRAAAGGEEVIAQTSPSPKRSKLKREQRDRESDEDAGSRGAQKGAVNPSREQKQCSTERHQEATTTKKAGNCTSVQAGSSQCNRTSSPIFTLSANRLATWKRLARQLARFPISSLLVVGDLTDQQCGDRLTTQRR